MHLITVDRHGTNVFTSNDTGGVLARYGDPHTTVIEQLAGGIAGDVLEVECAQECGVGRTGDRRAVDRQVAVPVFMKLERVLSSAAVDRVDLSNRLVQKAVEVRDRDAFAVIRVDVDDFDRRLRVFRANLAEVDGIHAAAAGEC